MAEERTIQEIVRELDVLMVEKYEKYKKLHEQFDSYRGKNLSDEDSNNVQAILSDIHSLFYDMYAGHYWARARYEDALKQIEQFASFMEELEKAGLIEIKKKL